MRRLSPRPAMSTRSTRANASRLGPRGPGLRLNRIASADGVASFGGRPGALGGPAHKAFSAAPGDAALAPPLHLELAHVLEAEHHLFLPDRRQ